MPRKPRTEEQRQAEAQAARERRQQHPSTPRPETADQPQTIASLVEVCMRQLALLERLVDAVACTDAYRRGTDVVPTPVPTRTDAGPTFDASVHPLTQPVAGPPRAPAAAETLSSISISSQRNTEISSSSSETETPGQTRDESRVGTASVHPSGHVGTSVGTASVQRGKLTPETLSAEELNGDPEVWASDPALVKTRQRGGGPTRIGGVR